MSITSAMPTAKKRKTRTRTPRVSNRPAITVSKMLPNLIDLLPGTESLVCPDCETWCPITGHDGHTPKLVPHHTNPARTPGRHRCIGSNRRVQIDWTIPQWQQHLADAIKETSSRRATNVLRKPKAAVAPAVTQITPRPLTPEAARAAYRTHVKQCQARCASPARCTERTRLAETVARLTRQEPRRQQVRAILARERARFDQAYAAQAAKERAAEWAKQAEAKVLRSALAKKAGTATEELNNTCRSHPADTVSEFRGPGLSLEPLRITV
jgi:hypothetical protein